MPFGSTLVLAFALLSACGTDEPAPSTGSDTGTEPPIFERPNRPGADAGAADATDTSNDDPGDAGTNDTPEDANDPPPGDVATEPDDTSAPAPDTTPAPDAGPVLPPLPDGTPPLGTLTVRESGLPTEGTPLQGRISSSDPGFFLPSPDCATASVVWGRATGYRLRNDTEDDTRITISVRTREQTATLDLPTAVLVAYEPGVLPLRSAPCLRFGAPGPGASSILAPLDLPAAGALDVLVVTSGTDTGRFELRVAYDDVP